MKNYLDYIEESTNVVKSKVKLSKLILILSYLVIWAFNIMVSWFFSAESISEAQAGAFQWLVLPVATIVISLLIGKNDFWGKRKWFAPIPVVYLCELWHERKFNLQSDRFANNHLFLYWSNCFGYRHSAWLCVFHGRKEYPKERVIYACQYINFNGLFIIQPIV